MLGIRVAPTYDVLLFDPQPHRYNHLSPVSSLDHDRDHNQPVDSGHLCFVREKQNPLFSYQLTMLGHGERKKGTWTVFT